MIFFFAFKPKHYDFEYTSHSSSHQNPPMRPPKPSSLSPFAGDYEKGDAPAIPPRRRNSPGLGGMESNGVTRIEEQVFTQPSVVSDDGDITPKGSPVFLKKPVMPSSDQTATAPSKHALAVR